MDTKLKDIRDYLFIVQCGFENLTRDEELKYQSKEIYRRLRALLNIYQKIVEEEMLLDGDKEYLEKYL